MTDSLWKLCQFGEEGSLEDPRVHDNFIVGLVVHLEQHLLILHTEYRDGDGPYELTDLRFAGLVAHYFDDVAAPSILFDIERVEAAWIVEQWSELFARRKSYGWPFTDLAELSSKLGELAIEGYRVMGSCGLDGFVLASSIEHRFRQQPFVIPTKPGE